jgi:hypothetical protein
VIDVPRVDRALAERGNQGAFERLMAEATWILAASFLLSAGLNFGLARWILQSPAGTPEFAAELGKMMALSWPVIVLPSMAIMLLALWRLFRGLKQLTGLELDSIFRPQEKKAKS